MASIKFCKKCDNKYYHEISENKLMYYCRVCGYRDDQLTNEALCVLNTQFTSGKQNFDHIINKYTKYDPTLPRIMIHCPNDQCKSNKEKEDQTTEAIYVRYDNVNLKFLYICTECEHKWKTDDTK